VVLVLFTDFDVDVILIPLIMKKLFPLKIHPLTNNRSGFSQGVNSIFRPNGQKGG
jgi:hypothetical protein